MNVVARVCRALAASAVTLAPALAPAPASAASPPPVDVTRLPPAGPAAPSQRTERFDDCVDEQPAPPGPADPGQLAGLDLAAMWALTRGAGQTVAVIDTGVARQGRLPHLVAGGDYVSTGDGLSDCDGHGTAVAGIIGAAPGPDSFAGIAPDATVLSIRHSSNRFRAVGDPAGSGYGDVGTLAAAVRTAADLGATVINISAVACLAADAALDDRSLGAALAYAVDVKNVVVVVAAGEVDRGQCPGQNPHDSSDWDDVAVVASPAWYDEYVLTVGSVGSDGQASSFTLAGPWVDVAAAGDDVVSLAVGGGLVTASGTGYAAPVVSAIVALVRARFPELTARQTMQRIEDTALRPGAGWNPDVGHGVVDGLAAVSGGTTTRRASPSAPVHGEPAPPQADPAPRRIAVVAAALCVVASGAIAALSPASRRLGRPPEPVGGD